MTHNIQNCPKCDHKNDSYDWDFNRTHVHMECVICGNHWLVLGKNTATDRASSGIAVVDEIQIANPIINPLANQKWQKEHLPHANRAFFSKSAITAGVFDKQKQFSEIELVAETHTHAKFPMHVFLMGAMFLTLITAPQFLNTGSPTSDVNLANNAIDPITTASPTQQENIFKFSQVKLMKIVRGKTKYISVRASARNVSAKVIKHPSFSIFMKNSKGKTIDDIAMKANGKIINPGEVFQISHEILDQTGATKSVSIAFQK